ncbi:MULTISPECIES: hypothetical protein [Pseudomonas]|uniref:Outer membrane protein assembly factor BamE n=1 Tax=Pseudomonas eucalypticola TaxID=2599595 RepID=A0A7D5H3Y2_9PSED|nr:MULTISPECIES: hypothetical protein [Pseudomonas]QKZ03323.1 hypothetical protein HWQ56_05795 [Pseudomonas eucalypticola]WAH57703.1 hypothetical protein LZ023_32860 [Pseudomonas silvicola]
MSAIHGKTFRNRVGLCLLVGVLAGCANSNDLMGNMNPFGVGAKKYDMDYLNTTLIAGKTTKAQVLELFGKPTRGGSDLSAQSKWTYEKREEGVEKYLNMAHGYVAPEVGQTLSDAQGQVFKAQGALNDAGSVVGGTPARQGLILDIFFDNDVVQAFSVI